jgi:hypothetical protein
LLRSRSREAGNLNGIGSKQRIHSENALHWPERFRLYRILCIGINKSDAKSITTEPQLREFQACDTFRLASQQQRFGFVREDYETYR